MENYNYLLQLAPTHLLPAPTHLLITYFHLLPSLTHLLLTPTQLHSCRVVMEPQDTRELCGETACFNPGTNSSFRLGEDCTVGL